jgi:WD40 repeat protein
LNRVLIEGQGSITSAAFSPDGKYVVTGDGLFPVGSPGTKIINGTIWLRDFQGKSIGKIIQGIEGSADYIAFSSDSKYIASLDNKSVKVWDLQGNLIKTQDLPSTRTPEMIIVVPIKNNKILLRRSSFDADIKAISRDGKFVARVEGNRQEFIKIFENRIEKNEKNQQVIFTLKVNPSSIKAINFGQDGRSLIGVFSDNTLRVWQLQSNSIGKIFEYDSSFISVAFSPDSRNIVTSSVNGTLKIWNLENHFSGQPIQAFSPPPINSVAVSPNGQFIVSGGAYLQLWDMNGKVIGKTFQGHNHYIESVTFTSDNKHIISSSFDQTIRLWNLVGENLQTIDLSKEPFDLEEVWSGKLVAVSSDNKFIVAGISTDEHHLSGIVQLLDINGNPKGQPFGNDWRFALSPNGKYIAVADANNTIQLWDIRGNRLGSLFRGHENLITSLAFSPDSQFIASGSWDNTVRLWDRQGNLITTFLEHQEGIQSVAFSPDGQYIASGSLDGTVRLWPANWKTMLKVACKQLKDHHALTAPKTDEEKSAARTCFLYGGMHRQ